MKKQFTIFLTLTFILGLVPLNFSEAITKNQIDAEVQVVCPDDYGNWYSGSGTIIDPKGVILTNKHVVTDRFNNIISTCAVGFIESISQEPNFYTNGKVNLAEVKYYTTADDMDAAILYLENTNNNTYSYVDIWNSNSNSLQFGDKIEAIGFPNIGGATVTYTTGDFSGFGSSVTKTQNYIKATVPLEHGNSGGAAYNLNGQFIGIPTFVIKGSLNSMSYILSINSITSWLLSTLGNTYSKKIEEHTPVIEKESLEVQEDTTSLSTRYVNIYAYPDSTLKGNLLTFEYNEVDEPYFQWSDYSAMGGMIWKDYSGQDGKEGYYVYFGKNINANPVTDGLFMKSNVYQVKTNGSGIYYLVIKARDKDGNISEPAMKWYPYWENNPNAPEPLNDSLSMDPDFKCYANSSKTKWIEQCWGHLLYDGFMVEWKRDPSVVKYYYDWVTANSPQDNWKFPPSEDKWGSKFTTGNSLKFMNLGKSDYELWLQAEDANGNLSKPFRVHFAFGNYLNENNPIQKFIDDAKDEDNSSQSSPATNNAIDTKLANRLKGYILLQVESVGEAWYVYPDNQKKHYLGRPADAFSIMRGLGLGITNTDLSKIPKSDESFTGDYNLRKRLAGKILLQVEEHGEAWYIYPNDLKRYYMGRPGDAFNLMRKLGLGITNSDLRKIDVGEIE